MSKKHRVSVKKIIVTVFYIVLIVTVAVVFAVYYESFFAQKATNSDVSKNEGFYYITKMEAAQTTPIEDRILRKNTAGPWTNCLRVENNPASV